jgi:hypothetical protein
MVSGLLSEPLHRNFPTESVVITLMKVKTSDLSLGQTNFGDDDLDAYLR